LTQFVSPDEEHDVLETCRGLKIKINTQKMIVRHVGQLPKIISLRVSNFQITLLKCLKNFCLLSFRRPECEILLPLLLLKTHYKYSIFVLIAFLLLKEDKAHIQQ
jgi:hypothetical protein